MKKWISADTTIKDIAIATGYSTATVSRVLNNVGQYYNEKTAKKILQAAKELNYTPDAAAQGLKSRRSHNIAFLVQQLDDFYVDTYRGMLEIAKQFGYSVTIMSSNYDCEQEILNINRLRSQRCDGVIVATGLLDDDLVHGLQARFPIVMVDRITTNSGIPCVSINDEEITYAAVKYLISLGHRRIAYISGPLRMITLTRRHAGYVRAFAESEIELDPSLLFYEKFLEGTDYDACYEFVKKIASELNFTALMIISDLGAIASMLAFQELGKKIPEDVSLVGFDNLTISRYCIPPLTTISQDRFRMGYEACRTLIDMIEGRPVSSMVIEAELIVRGTTAPPRGTPCSVANKP